MSDNSVILEVRAKNLTTEAFAQVAQKLKELEATSAHTATESGHHFTGLFGVITGGVAAGELLAHSLEKVLELVKEMPALLMEMGTKGGQIADVEAAFDSLAGGAENARAILAKMNEGTHQTVSDFELMKTANKMLADGFKGSADQFGTLAAGARLLAKDAGLKGGAAEAMDMLSQAIVTGRGRALNLIGIHINADEALARYSKTIHKSVDEMTQADHVAANAAEAYRQLRQRLKDAGDTHDSFGEKVRQAKKHFADFEEAIDEGIAKSPVLAAGMDAAGKALAEAFGSSQEEAVKKVVAVVNDLAIDVVDMAKLGVEGVRTLGNAWYGLSAIISGVTDEWVKDQVRALLPLEGLSKALIRVGGVAGATFAVMHQDILDVIKAAGPISEKLGKQFDSSLDSAAKFNKNVDGMELALTKVTDAMHAAVGKTAELGEAAHKTGPKIDDAAHKTTDWEKAVKKFTKETELLGREFANLEGQIGTNAALGKLGSKLHDAGMKARELGVDMDKVSATVADANGQWNQLEFDKIIADQAAKVQVGIGGLITEIDKLKAARGEMTSAEWGQMTAGYEQAEQRMTEATMSGTALRLAQIEDQRKKEFESFAWLALKDVEAYGKRKVSADAFYNHQRDVATGTADTIEERMRAMGVHTTDELEKLAADATRDFEQMRDSGKYNFNELEVAWKRMTAANAAAGHGWMGMFVMDLEKLPQLLQQAFTGGGGLSGAANAAGSMFGGDIGGKLMTGLRDKLKLGVGTFGETFAALGGPIGALLGPVLSGITHLFGKSANALADEKATADIHKLQDELLKTHGSLANISTLGKMVGIDLQAAWGDQSRAGLEHFKGSMDEFNKKLATFKQTFDTDLSGILTGAQGLGFQLPATLQPYLDQVEKLGLMSDANKKLLADFGDNSEISYKKMEEAAKRYGIATEALGPKFRAAKMHETAQQILEDLDLLQRGGADMNTVLGSAGMAGALSKIALESRKFGTEIPGNMRPWLEQLAKSGQLLDENGQKITDLSTLHFGDEIKVGLERIADLLQKFLDKLNLVPAAMGKIPRSVDVEINYRGKYSGDPNVPGAGGESIPEHEEGSSVLMFVRENLIAVVNPKSTALRPLVFA